MGIKEARAQALADGHHLTFLEDPSLTPAQQQYMHQCADPQGAVWTLGYTSFRKSQAAKLELRERLAQQHSVTVEHLDHAEFQYMARMLTAN